MRDLLIENCSLVIWIIVAIEAILGVSLAAAYKKDRRPIIICMILVDFGLLVDALLINLGGFFDGGLPEPVSRLRFILHGMLIPLLFPICGYSLKLKRKVMSVIWALTAVVMVLGLAEGMSITLELIQIGDVVRHNSADSSPAWAETIRSFLSFGTVIPLIIVGIAVWIKQKTPTLFLSGFLMFIFAALGPATGNLDLLFVITMIGEVLMILFFMLYVRSIAKWEK
ncbi:MAG TPA: hypothetical protein IAC39_07490 [Candidatus Faeciplasma pullistercoris]|uniref:Uncharacterized protein n=1 Tax=Candidatus Faeciplasma pullistercoris TaxID=2840800 RepID=A0A9D1GUN0_9FIRM|nr:hypothetical protein [Candidatus Faeciplasma pullistercoris]